jgi:hypothetical protein
LTPASASREDKAIILTTLRPTQAARRALGALPLCATILLAAPGARAQAASPEDVAAARSLGTEGTRLADTGDCNGAIPKLESAEKLYHAPSTLDRLGECEISVGRLVAGTEDLNRVVREPLAANAPPAFVAAKKRAQQALGAAQPRIGRLKIHVDGAPADKISVTVDGAPISSALLDADRPTDPGPHAVNASSAGYKPASENVIVREGAESTLSLKLEVDPTAVAAATPVSAEPGAVPGTASPAPAAGASTGPNRVPAVVAFSVGGAGLLVGTIAGVLALGSKSTLDGECPNKTCPSPKAQSDIDSLSSKATISTVGFGVGIAGVAVGAILLAVSHGSEKSASLDLPRPHWSPWIGVGSAGVGGTFQ